VGPVWSGGKAGEPELLADCYRNSLRLAVAHDLKSVAFPAISTGVYGYPPDQACVVAVRTVADVLQEDAKLDRVVFCCFDAVTRALYEQALAQEDRPGT
jgi:O-acetyl-ADP-ribose deacetylase (regulator of RNase III)